MATPTSAAAHAGPVAKSEKAVALLAALHVALLYLWQIDLLRLDHLASIARTAGLWVMSENLPAAQLVPQVLPWSTTTPRSSLVCPGSHHSPGLPRSRSFRTACDACANLHHMLIVHQLVRCVRRVCGVEPCFCGGLMLTRRSHSCRSSRHSAWSCYLLRWASG
jgi:hypothetical protein